METALRMNDTPEKGVWPHLAEAAQGLVGRVRKFSQKIAEHGLHRRFADSPEGAGFLKASHAGPAGSRSYKLYVPASYRGAPVPLIIMMHGCSQSADEFAAATRMNGLAEQRGCLVAYPMQPRSANISKCWNWFDPHHQLRGLGEPSLVAGVARQIMRDYAVDQRRVYVAGLSAGGAAAVVLGAAYPDLFAAVGVHSGLALGAANSVPSALSAMRRGHAIATARPHAHSLERRGVTPTIVFHGDRDQTVHPQNGRLVIEQAQLRSGANFRPEERRGRVRGGHSYTQTKYFDHDGRAMLEMWLVHGGGHAWSGGSPDSPYSDPFGPDASQEMLRFFLEHPKEQ
jgi:poly(hydroxyalkanoate) depolymerase family esterase